MKLLNRSITFFEVFRLARDEIWLFGVMCWFIWKAMVILELSTVSIDFIFVWSWLFCWWISESNQKLSGLVANDRGYRWYYSM